MQSDSISRHSPMEFWSHCLRQRVADIQDLRSLDNPDGSAWARRLDDELAAMHLAMCALRTKRNAVTPVCCLPSEVLARVFLFCTDALPWMNEEHTELGWIQVTHVCKYWRETALHYPHLWTNIHDGLNARWLKIILTRAKSAPISLKFDSFHALAGMPATYAEEVSKHMSHVRDICITVPTRAIWAPMLTSSASALQCLRLCYQSRTYFCLPEHTFQSHAPGLRIVELNSVYMPWSAPILCNLMHLKVELQDGLDGPSYPLLGNDNGSTTASFHQLLSALRTMSSIETLSLVGCLPSRSRHSPGDNIVDLPCVKSLTLDDEISRCSYLTEYLRIPSSCNLSLICTGAGERRYVTEVVSFFHGHVDREARISALQSVALEAYDSRVLFHTSRMEENDIKTQLSYTLQLPHTEDPSKSSWDIITTLCRSLPTVSIRHLEIVTTVQYTGPEWSMQGWIDVLGWCRAVKKVRFNADRPLVLDFCTALATHIDREQDVLFLENLHCLILDGPGVSFVRLGPAAGGQGSEIAHAFMKQMEARQKARPIRTICIKKRRSIQEQWFVKRLLELVPQIRWDPRA